jgi:uncharacterized small protein (TIGR04563 family)
VGKNQTRRQALYFPADMLAELQGEATRQDRSISWLIQQAWKVARGELQRIPSTTDYLPQSDEVVSAEETLQRRAGA